MMETLLFLAAPVTASIILAAMLGYFGTHILARRIIFIDIAVAQIAALGTMIGILLGFAEETLEVQVLSYLLTLLIIGGFAFLRTNALPIPAEAVIGIIYCLGLALSLLLAERIPLHYENHFGEYPLGDLGQGRTPGYPVCGRRVDPSPSGKKFP